MAASNRTLRKHVKRTHKPNFDGFVSMCVHKTLRD